MQDMTKENLKVAFAGESQASMKYTAFANKAQKEGFPEIARLFTAIAYAERVHAINHLKELGGVGDTNSNLDEALGGETYEIAEMYPAFEAVAKLQEEKGALWSIHYAIEAEKNHEVMFGGAQKALKSGDDISSEKIYVCSICGHTVFGEAPDRCPICRVIKEKFQEF